MNEVNSLFTNEEQTRKKTTPATGILFLSSSANKIKVRQRGCRFVDYTAPQGPGILFLDFPHSDKTAYLIRFFFTNAAPFTRQNCYFCRWFEAPVSAIAEGRHLQHFLQWVAGERKLATHQGQQLQKHSGCNFGKKPISSWGIHDLNRSGTCGRADSNDGMCDVSEIFCTEGRR